MKWKKMRKFQTQRNRKNGNISLFHTVVKLDRLQLMGYSKTMSLCPGTVGVEFGPTFISDETPKIDSRRRRQ